MLAAGHLSITRRRKLGAAFVPLPDGPAARLDLLHQLGQVRVGEQRTEEVDLDHPVVAGGVGEQQRATRGDPGVHDHDVDRDDALLTELGWTEFGLQTYYALLNCGFRMPMVQSTPTPSRLPQSV